MGWCGVVVPNQGDAVEAYCETRFAQSEAVFAISSRIPLFCVIEMRKD